MGSFSPPLVLKTIYSDVDQVVKHLLVKPLASNTGEYYISVTRKSECTIYPANKYGKYASNLSVAEGKTEGEAFTELGYWVNDPPKCCDNECDNCNCANRKMVNPAAYKTISISCDGVITDDGNIGRQAGGSACGSGGGSCSGSCGSNNGSNDDPFAILDDDS